MRIIAAILMQEDFVVQTYGFQKTSIIGSPLTTTKHLEEWGIDEFLLIQKDSSFPHLVENLTSIISDTSTPITVCGGLDSFNKCSELIKAGADRVCIQSLLFDKFDAVEKLSDTYGRQSITVKFDIIPQEGRLRSSSNLTNIKFIEYFNVASKRLNSLDIKDLLFYDVHADGQQTDPDFTLITKLDLSTFSLILGGGLNRKNCKDIYAQYNKISNDISLSFSNCLYQNEIESLKIINVLGDYFSQHRFYGKS